MTTLAWYVADLTSGAVIEELPLKARGTIERTIGQKSTFAADLDILDPSCPPNWASIDWRRCMIVPTGDDVPLCAYRVTDTPEIGGPTVALTLASLEGIAEEVYVPAGEFTDADDATVAAHLLGKIATGWNFELVVKQTGTLGDYVFSDYEDRMVSSALADLTSKDSGPEWITRIRWEDETHRQFVKTIEISPRVGRRIESTVIEDHHLAERRRSRSWAKLAVRTQAVGDGIGESRPMSPWVVDTEAIAAGVPPWELRVPAPTVEDEAGLAQVAQAAATRYRYGTQTWSLTIAQTEPGAPRLMDDYDVGDTVTMALDPTRYDPASWHGPARVIGYRVRMEGRLVVEVTPVFYNPDEEP